jgi:hypothetical protein
MTMLWVVTEFWRDDNSWELQGSVVIGVFDNLHDAFNLCDSKEEYCETTEVELNCEKVQDK